MAALDHAEQLVDERDAGERGVDDFSGFEGEAVPAVLELELKS